MLEKIENAKHIIIVAGQSSADTLGCCSAMYSFLLQKHKKVSWFCIDQVDRGFLFLPWTENIKERFLESADFAICINCTDYIYNIDKFNIDKKDEIATAKVLYDFFVLNSVKINKKMAIALYASLLEASEFFLSNRVDGITFALTQELIELGAEHSLCVKNMVKTASLAQLRLEALMLRDFLLVENAKIALFCLREDDFKATGAKWQWCIGVLKKVLNLPYVMSCILLIDTADLKIDVVVVDGFEIKEFKFSGLTMQEVQDNMISLVKKEF